MSMEKEPADLVELQGSWDSVIMTCSHSSLKGADKPKARYPRALIAVPSKLSVRNNLTPHLAGHGKARLD